MERGGQVAFWEGKGIPLGEHHCGGQGPMWARTPTCLLDILHSQQVKVSRTWLRSDTPGTC